LTDSQHLTILLLNTSCIDDV